MADRYRPSGPKSSRYTDSRDIDRERDRERSRNHPRDHNRDDYKGGEYKGGDYKGGNYKNQYSNNRETSGRDYYAGEPITGSKRHDSDRDGDHYWSAGSNVGNRGGNSAPRDPSRIDGKNGRRPQGPSASTSGLNSSQTRPPPSGPSGRPPIGPKGSSIPTGPSKFRPSGPSGYRSKEQDKSGKDSYRPNLKRQALPPQESTIGRGNKRPNESSTRADDYRKRQHYDDEYDYGGSYLAKNDPYLAKNEPYLAKNGYRSTYGQEYANKDDKFASTKNNNKKGKGPAKVKAKVKENGAPSNQKKPRKLLANSQIYLLRTMKPVEPYVRVQQVGEGTFGKVYKARNSTTGEYVALKRLRLESEREGFPITAMREIKLLQSFNHVNVVGLLEMMVEQNQIYMSLDYMDHDLTGLLTHPDLKLEESHRKFIFKQLMEGLNYLHKKRVIHRDIKGSNILLDNIGVVKIADFGLARTMKITLNGELPDYTNRVITIWYRPPELLLGSTDYGREVDIWGVGCILIELYSRVAAFQGFDEVGQLQKIFNIMGTPSLESWPTMDELPWFEMLKPKVNKASIFADEYKNILSELGFDLAEKLLLLDPKRRLTAEQALEHPYFSLDPQPEPLYFLKEIQGEWHEFETKKRRRMERKRKQELNSINTPGIQLAPNMEQSVLQSAPQSAPQSAQFSVEKGLEINGEEISKAQANPEDCNLRASNDAVELQAAHELTIEKEVSLEDNKPSIGKVAAEISEPVNKEAVKEDVVMEVPVEGEPINEGGPENDEASINDGGNENPVEE